MVQLDDGFVFGLEALGQLDMWPCIVWLVVLTVSETQTVESLHVARL